MRCGELVRCGEVSGGVVRLVEECTAGALLVYLLRVYFLYTICILVEFY